MKEKIISLIIGLILGFGCLYLYNTFFNSDNQMPTGMGQPNFENQGDFPGDSSTFQGGQKNNLNTNN